MAARVSMLLKSRASGTCFRACFLPGRAKDLSAPRYLELFRLKGTTDLTDVAYFVIGFCVHYMHIVCAVGALGMLRLIATALSCIMTSVYLESCSVYARVLSTVNRSSAGFQRCGCYV